MHSYVDLPPASISTCKRETAAYKRSCVQRPRLQCRWFCFSRLRTAWRLAEV